MEAAQRDHIRALISERQLRCLEADREVLREAREDRREARKDAERIIRRCKRRNVPVPESIAAQVPDMNAV